jgi:hypothetical protein
MSSHERFCELSALASIGQLTSEEDRQLNAHLRDCAECREVHAGYARVIRHELPRADAIRFRVKSQVGRTAPDADIRDRFLARARVEGINFSPDVEQVPHVRSPWFRGSWQLRFAVAVPALAALSILGMWVGKSYHSVPHMSVRDRFSAQLSLDNATFRAQLAALHDTVDRESTELSRTKHDSSVLQEALQKFEKQLEESRGRVSWLSAELQQAETDKATMIGKEHEKDSLIADLRTKNDDLHREHAELLGTSVIQGARIRELTESLQQQTAALERERQLMGVGADVRQLMGARSLHIIDVHDVDGGGKSAKSFGRVFYAEGQSLLFYAFDLPSGKLGPAKYTFQAWGQREYESHSVRNLGTFEVDNHEQRRWVLKVNDSVLLKGIDSVFVTAESLGDAKAPRGKKLMYAYIVGQANHP